MSNAEVCSDALKLRAELEAGFLRVMMHKQPVTLEVFIERFAWRHALDLWKKLDVACREHFVPDGSELSEYGQQLFLCAFKTHLGNDRFFWQPLFEKVAPILRRTDRSLWALDQEEADNAIWNRIIPLGMPLHGSTVFSDIREMIGNHACLHDSRPPSLYAMIR